MMWSSRSRMPAVIPVTSGSIRQVRKDEIERNRPGMRPRNVRVPGTGGEHYETATVRDLPPIPAPFDADGEIQVDRFKANLERWSEFGLAGLTVLGSNGESPVLSD